MAMNDEQFNKLSPEQVNKLARTINEAKDLTARQAEIIEQVLAGETEIGELRISYLNKYFDIYSKSLDSVVARKKSDLEDAFLIAEKKARDFSRLHKELSEREQPKQADRPDSKPSKASGKERERKESKPASSKAADEISTIIQDAKKALAGLNSELRQTKTDADNLVASLDTLQKLHAAATERIGNLAKASAATNKSSVASTQTSTGQQHLTQSIKNTDSSIAVETDMLTTLVGALEHSFISNISQQLAQFVVANNQSSPSPSSETNIAAVKEDQKATTVVVEEHRTALEPDGAATALLDSLTDKIQSLIRQPEVSEITTDRAGIEELLALNNSEIKEAITSFLKINMTKGDGVETRITLVEKDTDKASDNQSAGISALQEILTKLVNVDSQAVEPVLPFPEEVVADVTGLLQQLVTYTQNLSSFEPNKRQDEGAFISADKLSELVGAPKDSKSDNAEKITEIAQVKEKPVVKFISDDLIAELEAQDNAAIQALIDQLSQLKLSDTEAQSAIANTSIKNKASVTELDTKLNQEVLEAKHQQRLEEQRELHSRRIENIIQRQLEIEAAKADEAAEIENRLQDIRLSKLEGVTSAEEAAQSAYYDLVSKIDFENQYSDELIALEAKRVNAENIQKSTQELEALLAQEYNRREAQVKKDFKKQGKEFTDEDKATIRKQVAEEYAEKGKLQAKLDELTKKRQEKEAREKEKQLRKEAQAKRTEDRTAGIVALNNFKEGGTWSEKKEALKASVADYAATHDKDESKAAQEMALNAAVQALSNLTKQLDHNMKTIAEPMGRIDTRLQGSKNKTASGTFGGKSYWNQLVKDITSVGAVTPYFKQETFAKNVEALVERGIAFDLKQRAFLMTIQEKIATTFDVADGTLLRLIRIQQADSTAGRMGMESALTTFLNNMYENTEYLKDVAVSVRSSLQELESLMSGKAAAELEFEVQKWMGSLYSVGMSQEAVNSIASVLGQIGAGQIEGLTAGGASNLAIMAANEAGLSIADMLVKGIDSKETNKLLQATVNYLAELADSSKDNRVVQQQLAAVFGVKASDLRAATNLADSTGTIYGTKLSYSNMLGQLSKMAGTLHQRTSLDEMMTNVWENGLYTIAGSMASNPVSYFIYKLASVLDETVGGIDLPFVNVMGFGVDLNTTVADLMRVAAMSTGILGSLGPIISGLSSSFSGASMLTKMGIETGSGSLKVVARGDGGGIGSSKGGGATSSSGSGFTFVGNASGSDVRDSTIQESEDKKKQHMIEAKEEAEETPQDMINVTTLKIFELLSDVVDGKSALRVKVEDYGLTKNGGGSYNPLGGTAGLGGGNSGSPGGGWSSGETNSSGGSFSGSSVANMGGWITTG